MQDETSQGSGVVVAESDMQQHQNWLAHASEVHTLDRLTSLVSDATGISVASVIGLSVGTNAWVFVCANISEVANVPCTHANAASVSATACHTCSPFTQQYEQLLLLTSMKMMVTPRCQLSRHTLL